MIASILKESISSNKGLKQMALETDLGAWSSDLASAFTCPPKDVFLPAGSAFCTYLSDGKPGIFFKTKEKIVIALGSVSRRKLHDVVLCFIMLRPYKDQPEFDGFSCVIQEYVSVYKENEEISPKAAAFARAEVMRLSRLNPRPHEDVEEFWYRQNNLVKKNDLRFKGKRR